MVHRAQALQVQRPAFTESRLGGAPSHCSTAPPSAHTDGRPGSPRSRLQRRQSGARFTNACKWRDGTRQQCERPNASPTQEQPERREGGAVPPAGGSPGVPSGSSGTEGRRSEERPSDSRAVVTASLIRILEKQVVRLVTGGLGERCVDGLSRKRTGCPYEFPQTGRLEQQACTFHGCGGQGPRSRCHQGGSLEGPPFLIYRRQPPLCPHEDSSLCARGESALTSLLFSPLFLIFIY